MSARRHARWFGMRAPLVALAACGVLVLGTAPIQADPLDDAVNQVDGALTGGGSGTDGAQRNDSLTVVEDDDPHKEMDDPQSPDHASADNAEVDLAGQEVAGIGNTDATIEDDDDTSADASALSLGGEEVHGAHAEGNESNSAGDPLEPLCSGSDGALCAHLLYAEASSSDRNGEQHAESRTGVANACVGGSDTEPGDCDGPVAAGLLTSDSEIERDRDGTTRASSSSAVATICLADPATGTCVVGADAVTSEGQSHSAGRASKDSKVLGLTFAGEFEPLGEALAPLNDPLAEPQALELPLECPPDGHLACVYLNQGETYIGSAGHAVTALDATLLNGEILAMLSHSETLVHQADAEGPGGPGGGAGGGAGGAGEGAGGEGAAQGGQAADGGVLPNTGGLWSGLLSLALLGVGVGSLLVAWARQAAMVDAGLADGAA